MLQSIDPKSQDSDTPRVRLDAPHAVPDVHGGAARLDRRRVRQVLVGSAGRNAALTSSRNDAALRLCQDDAEQFLAVREHEGPVWKRFRQNFDTLTHIARDPLIWHAEEGAILTDLRETLVLTETALRQAEWSQQDQLVEYTTAASVLALARVVDERVDELFDRMERLCGVRQAMFRLSALIENVPCGSVPAWDELEQIARGIAEMVDRDAAVTLVDPESTDRSIRVAAHGLNVAQVAVRLALSTPAWRDEALLAAGAALVQDLGMLETPDEIWNPGAPGPLTPPQRAMIERHPAMSASIVEQMRGHDERIVAGVREHHERLDGSGYPDGLSGDAVGSLARLLAVADGYVSMQSPRPYRAALRADQALAEMDQAASHGQFDAAWTGRLPSQPPHWLRIPVTPVPPSSAPALSALAA